MSLPIPAEFSTLPKPSKETTDDDDNGIVDLFAKQDDDSTTDDYGSIENVNILGRFYKLVMPPDKQTLFAHRVWSGSKLLGTFLATNAAQYVTGKTTIEFGAGTGLPSLVALAHGSKVSILTDYPDRDILDALRETIGLNWHVCGQPLGRVAVVGHEWGSSVNEVVAAAAGLPCGGIQAITKFDVAIMSECLWMHRSHAALVQSLNELLDATEGRAVVTYAHHIPGLEDADDAFFDLCERVCGLTTVWKESHEMEYMWDSTKTIVVYLRVLSRQLKLS